MSSCLKKSFSLLELSIVLIVLSLLTFTVLSGAKIIARAKAQKVLVEIDKYKKAIMIFRDSYDVYPGNVDEETCRKWAEFSQLNLDKEGVSLGDYCTNNRAQAGGRGKVNDGFAGSSLMATTERWISFLNAMRFMRTSKIIDADTVSTTIADDEMVNGSYPASKANQGPWDEVCKDCISYENVKRTQAKTSFDSNGAATLAGILIDPKKTESLNLNFIRGSNNSEGAVNEHEFYDTEVQKNVNSQNVLILYKNTPAGADDTYGTGPLATGILTADIVNQIDVKIDDGRPGTGILIGLKNGYVKSVDNEDGKKRICYNTLQNDVSNGYYVSSTETKNGCNILYIIR